MYELLKDNKDLISQLAGVGVVDPHWLRDLEMYEVFKQLEIEVKCVMCRYAILAERYKISEENVRKRIKELRD